MRLCFLLIVIVKLVKIAIGTCDTNELTQDDNTLFLVVHKNNRKEHITHIENALNNRFYEACKDFFDIKFVYCDRGINDLMELKEKFDNVIDLNVPDHYKYPNLEEYGLLYAGDNGISTKHVVNKVISTDKGLEITNGTVSYKNAKIMLSSAVDTIKETPLFNVYNFIMSIRLDEGLKIYANDAKCNRIDVKDTILVCTKNELISEDVIERFAPLKVKLSTDCNESVDKLKMRLLGIVTPEVFHADVIKVPTILYDAPYLNDEILSLFPNALLMVDFRMLKYAFKEFMVQANWMRAAILSDDSFYSLDFEKELVDMFEEEGISYIVERCNTVQCSFSEAFLTLSKSGAYLVVVNIDRRNAKKLTNTYNSLLKDGMLAHRFLWLVRDWPFHGPSGLGNAFSISISPSVRSMEDYRALNLPPNRDTIGVIEGLRHFRNAYDARKPGEGHRNIKKLLEDSIKSMKTTKGYVHLVTGGKWSLIADMNITANGTNIHTYKATPRLSSNTCLVRGNYYKPCNNDILLILILVIIIFLISMLMVVVYFHKTSPIKHSNYIQLN